ncbi:MAG: flagellar assembly protein FliH [Myxococcaceae bacterium]|nr:flagellar assembly protein FliH [Myxococcaceae bacterium]
MSATPRLRSPAFLGDPKVEGEALPAHFQRLPRRTPPAAPPPPWPTQHHAAPSQPQPAPAPVPPVPPAVAASPTPVPSPLPGEGSPLAAMMPLPSAPPPPLSLRDTRKLTAAVENLRSEAARLAEQARADALEIGFQIAKRILELEVSARPEPLFALVRSAVRRLGDARHLVIKLHPDDAEVVGSTEGRQKLGLTLMQVDVVADATLEHGDCVVESENAMVDGRLTTRLEELKRGLDGALKGDAP